MILHGEGRSVPALQRVAGIKRAFFLFMSGVEVFEQAAGWVDDRHMEIALSAINVTALVLTSANRRTPNISLAHTCCSNWRCL